jgi:hypothetical protein
MDHLARFQCDEEKGAKWTEKEIRHLQEIAGPYLCSMMVQEGFPSLSTGLFWTDLSHRKRQNSEEDLAGRSLLGYACGEQPSQSSS